MNDTIEGTDTRGHCSVLNLGDIALGRTNPARQFCLSNLLFLSGITKNLSGIEGICLFFSLSTLGGAGCAEFCIKDYIIVPNLIVI